MTENVWMAWMMGIVLPLDDSRDDGDERHGGDYDRGRCTAHPRLSEPNLSVSRVRAHTTALTPSETRYKQSYRPMKFVNHQMCDLYDMIKFIILFIIFFGFYRLSKV